jgi:hypothetical protein
MPAAFALEQRHDGGLVSRAFVANSKCQATR